MNSGTAALHLALAAIGLRAGDEVIVPTDTFTATAEAVTYFGARPILTDCRRDTFNLDERALEQGVSPRTRAIIPVHFAGQPCEMEPILDVAERHKIRVIEDAAHALPAKYDGQMIGTIGEITAFSFYATKTLTTGEGGMATTSNPEFADEMRTLSLHGINNAASNRYSADGSWSYQVVKSGFKYNMTDMAAALGINQLRKAERFRERRDEIATRYSHALGELDAVRIPALQSNVQHAWHLYIVLLNLEALKIDRSQFIEELKSRNIGASVHFIPLHLHPYYCQTFGYRRGDFPNAEWVFDRCVSLPIYPDMSDRDVDDVVEAVQDVVREYRR